MTTFKTTLAELADTLGATIQGDPSCQITGLASIANANPGDLTFLVGAQYQHYLADTKASAVLLADNKARECSVNALIVSNPELAFAKAARLFYPKSSATPGIHPSAVIGENCQIASGVSIAASCVLGNNVSVGENTVIKAGTIIEDDVSIGRHSILHSRVTVYNAVKIGDRVVLHSGAVVGADGFGLTQDNGRWISIPQMGSVIIGNDVEVGANTCIDRGALDDTVIGEGVKLDNLVQVAHNVQIGAHTVVAGNAGIAGSAKIGRHCMIGGASCINGHITLVDGVIITGIGMVAKSIDKPGIYSSGTLVQSNREWRKNVMHWKQLDKMAKRIRKLERKNESSEG